MRNRKTMYYPGPPFKSTTDAVAWIEAKGWCMWRGKPKHFSVIKNFSLTTIACAAYSGTLRPAFRTAT
ncbi:MAG: hypothetical protein ABIH23_19500 [bacterium]